MRPGTEPAHPCGAAHGADEAEGASYARELLAGLSAGTATAADLATLLEFLRCGPMLRGACEAIAAALRGEAAQGGER